ncbi:hypothetical protein FJTKL_01774 [Diaporthe vaccinii]|uniref:Uncharacterized protein n=1 Tax=Diaporthe vaccinii TaxID=105482 RepID=A0ABR4F485_9PEZI
MWHFRAEWKKNVVIRCVQQVKEAADISIHIWVITNTNETHQIETMKIQPSDKPGPTKGTHAYLEQQIAAEKNRLANLVQKRRNLEAELRKNQKDTDDIVKKIKTMKKDMAALPRGTTVDEEVEALIAEEEVVVVKKEEENDGKKF